MLVYTRLIWRSVYRPTYWFTCQHYRPICQSTCQHSLGRLSLNTLANMLTESRVTDVSGEIDRGLANMSTNMVTKSWLILLADMSIEYRPIVLTDTQPRGAQITQDPLKAETDNTYRDLDYFGYHKNRIQGCALRKIEGSPVL